MFVLSAGQKQGANSAMQSFALALVLAPLLFSLAAAFVQHRFVLKPWHEYLQDLIKTSARLEAANTPGQATSQTSAQSAGANKASGASSLPRAKSSESIADQPEVSQSLPLSSSFKTLKKSMEVATEQIKDVRLREKALIQHAVDVICVIDLKCKILSVNPACVSVWGYRPEELVGAQITDFLVSDDVKNTMKAIVGAEKSIDKIFFENRFRKKSGDLIDLLWSAHLSASDRGLFCIAHDITERKRAEQVLKENEQKVRRILEALPAGVAVVNKDGLIEFMNKAAYDLSGQPAETKELKACDIFSFYKGAAIGQKDLLGGSVFDCQIAKVNGERFPAEASLREFDWPSSSSCLVIFLDATMRHETEKAKREFVAMISHDLRTPLTSISLIFAYYLDGLGGKLNEDGVEFAEKGQESCQRLISLVQDLLDLEKMKAGKFKMEMRDTPLVDLVTSAVDALVPYADSHGISLSLNCDNVKAHCDGGRIIQVLINLVSNAIKFSLPEATVRIEVKDCRDSIAVSIANKGRSIAKDKLEAIFEKFEQANRGDETEKKGTGLGLAISKTIIEQHGGSIWAESSEADGTVFHFSIPSAKTDAGSSLGSLS